VSSVFGMICVGSWLARRKVVVDIHYSDVVLELSVIADVLSQNLGSGMNYTGLVRDTVFLNFYCFY